MQHIIFSLKLEDVVLQFQDANFSVSSPFNKSEINDLIIQKLNELNFIPDLNSITYVIKENHLHAEGWAYEKPKPVEFDFIY